VVSSPPLTAPLSVTVKGGSSPYWLALLPANTGNPLSSVQVQDSGGNWTTLTRSGYGYWLAPQGAGSGPFTVRMTDTAGNQATLPDVQLSPGQTQNTGTWMYGH
jgi:expansin (peptidoglycan-binding protein)